MGDKAERNKPHIQKEVMASQNQKEKPLAFTLSLIPMLFLLGGTSLPSHHSTGTSANTQRNHPSDLLRHNLLIKITFTFGGRVSCNPAWPRTYYIAKCKSSSWLPISQDSESPWKQLSGLVCETISR